MKDVKNFLIPIKKLKKKKDHKKRLRKYKLSKMDFEIELKDDENVQKELPTKKGIIKVIVVK